MNPLKNFLKRKKYNRKDGKTQIKLFAFTPWRQKNKSFVLHGVFVPLWQKKSLRLTGKK